MYYHICYRIRSYTIVLLSTTTVVDRIRSYTIVYDRIRAYTIHNHRCQIDATTTRRKSPFPGDEKYTTTFSNHRIRSYTSIIFNDRQRSYTIVNNYRF